MKPNLFIHKDTVIDLNKVVWVTNFTALIRVSYGANECSFLDIEDDSDCDLSKTFDRLIAQWKGEQ